MNCFWHSEPSCHLDPLVFQCVDQALDNMESSSRLQLMGKTSNNTQFKYCLMPCDTTLLGVRETTIYTVSFNINSIHAYYIPCSTYPVVHSLHGGYVYLLFVASSQRNKAVPDLITIYIAIPCSKIYIVLI